MRAPRSDRLSPCSRGEDEGEGFEGTRPVSTLPLPLSQAHSFALTGASPPSLPAGEKERLRVPIVPALLPLPLRQGERAQVRGWQR